MPLVINTLWDYRQDFDGIFPGLREAVGTAERNDGSPDLLCGATENEGGPDTVRALLGQRRLMRAQLSGWKSSRLHPRQVVEHKVDGAVEEQEKGRTQYANGDRHTGEYVGGKRHGTGRLSFHSGERYVGGFEKGERQGHGHYYFTNGDCYVGPQTANQPDGVGYFYTKKIDRWDQTEFKNGEYLRDIKIGCDPPPE
eukprot:Hpha_TRINITY_DN15954_c1_g7::TRINITY_DN15954_c1_g7_i1::g.75583::m.75583